MMEKQVIQPVIGKILDKSTTIALMIVIAWLLWGKLNKIEEREYNEGRQDKKEMVDALNRSSFALEKCARALDRNTIAIDRLAQSN